MRQLNIEYPYTVFKRPVSSEGWLIKPMTGEGGIGIQRYTESSAVTLTGYWQKYIEGTAGSVLFLADGKKSRVIGFHTQNCTILGSKSQFIFSGINNLSPLSQRQELKLARWIQVIVAESFLVGLNSLDFVVADERVWVLEINPRISASMQLYDRNLLSDHLHACEGRLTRHFVDDFKYCGYRILYADATVQIKGDFIWPAGCLDIPAPGSIIRKGQPICSMIARNRCSRSVFEQLIEQQHLIEHQIKGDD